MMSYDELNVLCRKCWEKDVNYLHDDSSEEKRDQRRYYTCKESKHTYIEFTSGTNPF